MLVIFIRKKGYRKILLYVINEVKFMNITKEQRKFYTAKNDKVFKAVMCDEEDD